MFCSQEKTFGRPIVNYFIDLNLSIITPDAYHNVYLINDQEQMTTAVGLIEYSGRVKTLKTKRSDKKLSGYRNTHTDEIISIEEWKRRYEKYFDQFDDEVEEDEDQDVPFNIIQKVNVIRQMWVPLYVEELVIIDLDFHSYEGNYYTQNKFIKNNFSFTGDLLMCTYYRQAAIKAKVLELVEQYAIPFSNASHSFLEYAKLYDAYAFSKEWNDKHISEKMYGKVEDLQACYEQDMLAVSTLIERERALRAAPPHFDFKKIFDSLLLLEKETRKITATRATRDHQQYAVQLCCEIKKSFETELRRPL